jgi:hypothetical protein
MMNRECIPVAVPRCLLGMSLWLLAVGCGNHNDTEIEIDAEIQRIDRFRISGPSMSPTLWGESVRLNCPDCQIPIRSDVSVWEAARVKDQVVCWHCGSQIDATRVKTIRLPPDQVQVLRTPWETIDPGDLVVWGHSIRDGARDDSQLSDLHVKRVLATPGQKVSVDEQGKLRVDGQIPRFFNTGKILVDWEQYRQKSRWHPIGDRWWRYHHALVHRGHRPGPILDDYPGNLGIDRRLHPVEIFTASLSSPTDPQPVSSASIEQIQRWQENSEGVLGLTTERPIAIRLSSDATTMRPSVLPGNLVVEREVVYRIDGPKKRALAIVYPIQLGENEFFLVGDNVPLSIDSRTWGPVHNEDFVGRVIKN